jgi:hypothetical protein
MYPTDSEPDKILHKMESDFIIEKYGKSHNITNLGANTFAKDLNEFYDLCSH